MFASKMLAREAIETHGVRIAVDLKVVPFFIRKALYKRSYEKHELTLINKVIKKGDLVIEIGAGIGLVSLVATHIAGEGCIHSYEANPEMESVIRHNYRLNGWQPNLVMQAVTADGREIELHRHENIISTSIIDRGLKSTKMRISSTALPELMKDIEPTVLIMDAEGAEDELLVLDCIQTVRDIIVEMHPQIIGQCRVDALCEHLLEKGFEIEETCGSNIHFTNRNAGKLL